MYGGYFRASPHYSKYLGGFCENSRQKVNMAKTKIFYLPNVPRAVTREISRVIRVTETKNLGKYFRIPLLSERVSRGSYQPLLDMVRSKLVGWKRKNLSFVGRATLVKLVLSALPIYSLQTSMVPQSILEKLKRYARGFL